MLDSAIEPDDILPAEEAAGSYVRELSRVLHRCNDGARLIAMLQALGDESFAHSVDKTEYYVVAGYLGNADSWANFEANWRSTMKELGITAIGLHASPLEAGLGDYYGMLERRRREIEYRVVVDIAASNLLGFIAAIDMVAYRKHEDKLSASLGPRWGEFNRPHLLTVRNWVHSMCMALTPLKSRDKIAFVLDRNGEFFKRAHEWYQIDINSEAIEWRDRLGQLSEDNRNDAVGLQAADLLAFSAMRQLSNRPPWHWKELTEATKIVITVADDSYWSEVANGLPARDFPERPT